MDIRRQTRRILGRKKKRALNKKNQFPLPNVRVRSCCSCDTCCLNHQLVPMVIVPTVFVSSFRYRNALGFPVIMYQALEIHIKQFHGQLFSHSDEVAISVQCTLVYNNLVKPLGICSRTGSKSKNKNPLIRKRVCIEMISKIYGQV